LVDNAYALCVLRQPNSSWLRQGKVSSHDLFAGLKPNIDASFVLKFCVYEHSIEQLEMWPAAQRTPQVNAIRPSRLVRKHEQKI